MPGCAVATCNNYTRTTQGSEIRYFGFPKDQQYCQKWITACKRDDKFIIKNSYICSAHFEFNCFAEPSLKEKLLNYTVRNKRGLKSDALPTINLPGRKNKRDNSERSFQSEECAKLNNSSCHTNSVNDLGASTSTSSDAVHGNLVKVNIINNNEVKRDKEEIANLKQKLLNLESVNRQLQVKLSKSEKYIEQLITAIGKIFTPGQVKKLLNPENKRVLWSPNDIASCISLRRISPKAYRYLKSKGYPLPGLSTLRKWAATFSIEPGILNDNLTSMPIRSSELKAIKKIGKKKNKKS